MANPSYPNSVKQWTDKVDFVDDVSASHINEAYAEIIAIEEDLINNPVARKVDLNDKVDNSRVLTDVPANAKFTDTTYSEISEAEINTGTASTLRAITARRITFILDKVQGWINALTKTDIGLDKVDNVKQASKTEFDSHTGATNNPHSVTKSQVDLGNVDNVKQMPIAGGTFIGIAKAQTNTSYTTAQIRNITLSTGDPTGGSNGDIWIKYK